MSFLAGCPAGVVFAFAGPTAPDGWLLCDGTPISRTTYANLFATIGVAHGSGDGSTTFNLPDYRGRMLRGRDGGVARDPDRASRTAANAGGNTGDNVGSVQSASLESHGHNVNGITAAGTGGGPYQTNLYMAARYDTAVESLNQSAVTTNGGGIIPNGGNETRPINAYVNYIIKI